MTEHQQTTPGSGTQATGAEGRALAAARGGSGEAFRTLQALLDPAVRRFLYRLLGRAAAPEEEDIVRGVFLALFRNLHRLDAPERLRPFVFRVARNLCYDELRRRGRAGATLVPLDAPAAWLPDGRPGPDAALIWSQAYAEVRRAIDALPEPQRLALVLLAEEGMSHAEIAEALGTEVGTVKSRIHAARRSLARRLPPDTLAALGLAPDDGRR